MKYLILTLLISCNLAAQVDFKYGATARSYPSLGGDAFIDTGYNQILWGDNGQSPLYGLIRPSVTGSSSVVVSTYDAKLTVYPISFIGLGAGHKEVTSEYDEFTYFDCTDVACEGKMFKDYSFGKLALAYGPFLSTFSYSEFRNTYHDDYNTGSSVAEYEYILATQLNNEKQIQRTYFLGYKLGDDLIGLVSDQVQFLESNKDYQLHLAIYQKRIENFKMTFGIGSLHSSDQKPGLNLILRMEHILLPSLALF
ncbi:MAG: hypothetical protein HON90_04895 [Halobacteriovoraceae bacterium]|nr:hypothetical protein [Halobacteriovoraceae bacterium]